MQYAQPCFHFDDKALPMNLQISIISESWAAKITEDLVREENGQYGYLQTQREKARRYECQLYGILTLIIYTFK